MERLLPIVIALALGCALLAEPAAPQPGSRSRPIAWEDLAPPTRTRLATLGVAAPSFSSYVGRLRREHERRVHEGDLDHLVFYLLQSTHFTRRPAIEPALSARALVESLSAAGREAFLRGSDPGVARAPAAVHARITDFVTALDSADADPRLAYFRTLAATSFPDRRTRTDALAREYVRAMRFLYEKEFVAQRSPRPAEAVEDLYRSRGLSTDTAVEAGYLVYLGLGIARALDPQRDVRRVLIVGPGLDLAPRTGLLESSPPESYQPWAVIDALLSLRFAGAADLRVVAADINPRVVEHLRRSRTKPPLLRLVSGISESDRLALTREYRDYFESLGRSVGSVRATAAPVPGHLAKAVAVSTAAARMLDADALDVVTDRLDGPPFDIVIATNILPYFDDVELGLAITNIASMLAPGGWFLHNETRSSMDPVASAAGLALVQSRQAIIATIRGAAAPLGDSVLLYRKTGRAADQGRDGQSTR